MAFSTISRTLLSKMSISAPNSSPAPSPAPSSSSDSAQATPTNDSHDATLTQPLSVVGGNHRNSCGSDSAPFSGSFSPIRNMELYPLRAKVIEEGCVYEECPVSLLCGENVEYICSLMDGEVLYLTNYRLLATQEAGLYSVPLRLIEGIEMQAVKETLTFLCRDGRAFRLMFPSSFKARSFVSYVQTTLQPATHHSSFFAFIHRAYSKDLSLERGWEGGRHRTGLYGSDWIPAEYRRLGLAQFPTGMTSPAHKSSNTGSERVWRVSQCNAKYEVCATYPKLLIVPQSVSDEELVQAAKFRMMGRLPVVVWRHPYTGGVIVRSSQPQVGVLSWRSSQDENLLQAISQACLMARPVVLTTPYPLENGGPPTSSGLNTDSGPSPYPVFQAGTMDASIMRSALQEGVGLGVEPEEEGAGPEEGEEEGEREVPRLVVMDLRSYAATLGNRAKGGGSECTDYYPNCDVEFKGLPNIHSVRKSFQQLRAILVAEDNNNFLSHLESSQWLHYLCQLLGVACDVVGVVHTSGLPVLIHCSDGWDRTTQVVALAQLLLDPYYRTIGGFQVLVEREWLSYGHKFAERCGHMGEDTNQRSPVFLQWLDCIHQLIRQFPCDFQFNELFLLKLGRHAYSCLYGTFLGNCVKEREAWRVEEDTSSVWSLLHEGNPDILNYLYQPPVKGQLKVLHPVASMYNMLLWKAMYCDPLLTAPGGHAPSAPASPSPDYDSLITTDSTASDLEEKVKVQTPKNINSEKISSLNHLKHQEKSGGVEALGVEDVSKGCEIGVDENGGVGSGNELRANGVKEVENSVKECELGVDEDVGKGKLVASGVNEVIKGAKESSMCNGEALVASASVADKALMKDSSSQHNTGATVPMANGTVCSAIIEHDEESSNLKDVSLSDVIAGCLEEEGPETTPNCLVGDDVDTRGDNPAPVPSSHITGRGQTETNHMSGRSQSEESSGRNQSSPILANHTSGRGTSCPSPTNDLGGRGMLEERRGSLGLVEERRRSGDSSPALSYHDCHESLHSQIIRSGSTSSMPQEGACPNGGVCPDGRGSSSGHANLPSTDEYYTISPTPVVMETRFGGVAEREKSVAGASLPRYASGKEDTPTASARYVLDVDGLPRYQDAVHIRLRTLQQQHQAQVSKLTLQLKRARSKVSTKSDSSHHDHASTTGEASSADIAESPSSLASWDYVDEDGEGVRWIPDHAVTHCFGCGLEFWTARRKHHCRSCGKVFCGSCSDFFCQVPHEQLFDKVRVCEKCFYKLDGHLQKNNSNHMLTPA